MKDIEETLKELGIPAGEWSEKTLEGNSNIIENQKENLEKIKAVLERTVKEDFQKIAALREKLKKLQHGGGH